MRRAHNILGLLLCGCLAAGCEPEGEISGTITYLGPFHGVVAVGLFNAFPPIYDSQGPFAMTVVGEFDGSRQSLDYRISPVDDGTWYVAAFMDVGGDDLMDPEMTAFGNEEDPVTIDFDNDEDEATADIVLPAGSGTVRGEIRYHGTQSGYVMAALFKTYPPLEDTDGPFRTTLVGESEFVDGIMPFDIDFIEDGTWYVAAFMDIGSDDLLDPEIIGFDDKHPVTIQGGARRGVDWSVVELPSGDGIVEGQISYTGPYTGLVMAGLFNRYPPLEDADGPYYTAVVGDSAFESGPMAYKLEYVEPGTWYVAAFMDLGKDDPLNPEMVAFSSDEPVVIGDSGTALHAVADIELPSGEGSIEGVVRYQGNETGLVMVALFKAYPPLTDGDGPFHTTLLDDADFAARPWPFRIDFVEPGEWYLAGFMDIGRDDPLDPDMIAFSADNPITIGSGPMVAHADVELPAGHGRVEGEISYSGPFSGQVLVALFKAYPPLDDADGPFFATLVGESDFAAGPMPYEIKFVDDGEWFVAAMLDVDGDAPLDPEMVVFSDDNPVVIDAISDTAHADVTLPGGSGIIRGSVSYTGQDSGVLMVSLFFEFPPSNDAQGPLLPTLVGQVDFSQTVDVAYEIPFVSAGLYYVVAAFDIGSDAPLEPEVMASSAQKVTLPVGAQIDDVGLQMYAPCEAYCGMTVQTCTQLGAPQYGGATPQQMMGSCLSYCQQVSGWSYGMFGSDHGNTANCRLYYANAAAMMASPELCTVAGPSGGNVCGTWCDNYCDLALTNCTNASLASGVGLYTSRDECLAVCQLFPANGLPGATSGNSVQCRMTHLGQAGYIRIGGGQPDAECSAATFSGGGVCQ